MSVRPDGGLDDSVSIPIAAADGDFYTLMVWFFLEADLGSYGGIISMGDAPSGFQQGIWIGVRADGTTIEVFILNGTSSNVGTNLNLNQWYHICVSGEIDGSTGQHTTYLDGQLDGDNNPLTPSAPSAYIEGSVMLGNTQQILSNEPVKGRFAQHKAWWGSASAAELTQKQIQNEMHSAQPKVTDNFQTDLKLYKDTDMINEGPARGTMVVNNNVSNAKNPSVGFGGSQ